MQNNCYTESEIATGEERVIPILCIVTFSLKSYRYFIYAGGLHMITHGSFVSFSPILLPVSLR